MAFQLSDTVNKDKVFLVKRSELEGRLDPFCYIPSLVFLDNLIKSKTDNRLKDFAVGYSSGATPSKDESDIHYTSKEKGFPFVRVQNLSTTGELNFDNMKYISKETHNGLLNRSKVFAGDLLVKITGVGRMAVASVTPECFEGNINQHIVVIRTESAAISQNLAAFINLDCIEKLASKRATGGTRPALDYPALFSLPVISDERFSVKMAVASAACKQKEAQAQQLLDSIDTYLMNELGIELPTIDESSISQRMFVRKFSEVSGGRFDVSFYLPRHKALTDAILKSPNSCFCDLVELSNEQWDQTSLFQDTFPYIEIGEIDTTTGEIKTVTDVDINEAPSRAKMIVRNGDLLISTTRPTRGAIAFYDETLAIASTGFCVIKGVNSDRVNKMYLFHVLRSHLCLNQMEQRSSGGNYPAITTEELKKVLIPLPSLEKQNRIAAHIQTIRDQAKQLRDQAVTGLEQAKQEVEAMIIGQH